MGKKSRKKRKLAKNKYIKQPTNQKGGVTISLCMIVKNEELNLKGCLESVKDIVDQIIIVDTGSTDATIDIAKTYNAEIYHFKAEALLTHRDSVNKIKPP